MKILIAGLAGASLGTEIIKSLKKAGKYEIYGCDISNLAYGLYSKELKKSFVVNQDSYIESIINICLKYKINYIIPGGEQPMVILSKSSETFRKEGINVIGNSNKIVELFSNKSKTFEFLKENGFDIPLTITIEQNDYSTIDRMHFPCIVKPSSGTGGSDSVFLATSKEECILYVELLHRNGKDVIIQEYIGIEEGEFTIGILNDLESNIISSVVMKRVFNSKLSIAYNGKKGLISSGYSQGLIDEFPDIRKQAENISKIVKSIGPLNIQGRIKNGVLIPFEINPRFSASTYLRALAGANEIDLYIKSISGKEIIKNPKIKPGYYLRSFEEIFIEKTL